ncbi:hypothetical protein V6O07_09965, partial [Arthrospira platensis SPKY2]
LPISSENSGISISSDSSSASKTGLPTVVCPLSLKLEGIWPRGVTYCKKFCAQFTKNALATCANTIYHYYYNTSPAAKS